MKKLILFFTLLIFSIGVYSQDYNAEWPHGTEFSAYATPNEGWEFVNWTENGEVVSVENPYTFVVTGPRDLIANFQRLTYLINIQINPEGSGEVEGAGEYPPGAEVMLHAFPNENYKFNNYLDLTSGDVFNDNPLVFLAEQDKDIQVNFIQASVLPKEWLWTVLTVVALWLFLAYFLRKNQLVNHSQKNKKL